MMLKRQQVCNNISDVSFITDHVSTNKTKIVCRRRMRLMFTCALGCYVVSSFTSTQTFGRALTASVDSCAEIKSVPLMV